MLLEDGADTDGRRFLPEGRAHDLLRRLVPIAVSLAVGVGIGKEHDPAPPERTELVGLELIETARCQPDVLRVVLAEDDGRLLCLYDGNGVARCSDQQMQAEQAVKGLVLRLRLTAALAQQRTHPGGVLLLAAVAVEAVIHHLAIMGLALMVDLPEDHAAVFRSTQQIAAGGMEHLLEGEVATADHCLAELRVDRPAALHHRGGMIEMEPLLLLPADYRPKAGG